MEFSRIWNQVKALPKEHVRSLVDDAQAVMHGTPNRAAAEAAVLLLKVVRQIHPDLVA